MAGFKDGRGRLDITGASLVNESKIPRQYFQIPRDQQELLGRPEAWNLKGLTNVPPKLLKDVKETHIRKSKNQASATPQKAIPSGTSNGSSRAGPTSNHFETHPVAELGDDEEDEDDDAISWPSSSETHLRPPQRVEVEELPPIPTPTPVYGKQASSPPVGRNLARSAPRTRYKARLAMQELPSSSLGSELDMEYQPPRAITDVVVNPVNRVLQTAKPAPTPPSAQIVPCTWKEKSSPRRPDSMEEPQPKRKRLMKELKFDNSLRADQGTAEVVNETVYTQESGSTTLSSIPAEGLPVKAKPAVRQPMREDSVVLRSDDSHIPLTGISSSGQAKAKPTKGSEQRRVVSVPKLTEPQAASKVVDQQNSSNSDKIPPNGPPSQAPFTAFCVAYPDFDATLGGFIRAVISIQELQRMGQLAEFLYDDFIRVFCTEYMDYMRTLHPSSQPLTTIVWYNRNVPGPVYMKRVMTRSNLHDVERAYPQKYHRCQPTHDDDTSSQLLLSTPGDRPSTAQSAHEASTTQPRRETSMVHSRHDQSLTQSTAQSMQEPAFQDRPQFAARDSSLPVSPSPSEIRSSPPPSNLPGTVVLTERLESTHGYVMIMSNADGNRGSQDHNQNAPAVPMEIDVKEEAVSLPIEQVASIQQSSQSTSRFETQALETQVINVAQPQVESTPAKTQDLLTQPPATSTARFESQAFEAQVLHVTQGEVESPLAETQGPLTQSSAASTTRFETQVIDFTQEDVAPTLGETQPPPATARTVDHDITRIPETAIKPKAAQRAAPGAKKPKSSPASSAVPQSQKTPSQKSRPPLAPKPTEVSPPLLRSQGPQPQPASKAVNGPPKPRPEPAFKIIRGGPPLSSAPAVLTTSKAGAGTGKPTLSSAVTKSQKTQRPRPPAASEATGPRPGLDTQKSHPPPSVDKAVNEAGPQPAYKIIKDGPPTSSAASQSKKVQKPHPPGINKDVNGSKPQPVYTIIKGGPPPKSTSDKTPASMPGSRASSGKAPASSAAPKSKKVEKPHPPAAVNGGQPRPAYTIIQGGPPKSTSGKIPTGSKASDGSGKGPVSSAAPKAKKTKGEQFEAYLRKMKATQDAAASSSDGKR
jgi:hypothetical protein